MPKRKITFVIGAGASFEADLPIGKALTAIIANKLNIGIDSMGMVKKGDELIYQAISISCNNQESGDWSYSRLLDVCSRICLAMPLAKSIDIYIHDHKDNAQIEFMGKLGIVQSILEAEAKSRFFITGKTSADIFSRLSNFTSKLLSP